MLKKIFLLIILLFTFIACKRSNNEKTSTQKNDTILHEYNFEKLYTKKTKDTIPEPSESEKKNIIDSLKYFTISPATISEYYNKSLEDKIKNSKYMRRTVKVSKYLIPELIEKISDTTTTSIWRMENYYSRVGDISVELLDIAQKEKLQNIILEEFNDKDIENIRELSQRFNGFEGYVYYPLFYNKDGSVNMKNRMRLYELYKRKLK